MKITKKQLIKIINEQTHMGMKFYGEQDIRNPILKKNLMSLASEIFDILNKGKLNPKSFQIFDSGYTGILIDCDLGKYLIIDQKGHVGLEDQRMGYISLYKGKSISNSILTFSPNYYSRKFGDANIRDDMRKKAYAEIKSYFKKLKA